MDLYDNFIELLSALEKEEVDYCLIGGFAIVLYGSKRTTQDLDIFIRDTEENISKLQIALASLYNDESIKEITKNELIEYSVIRYGTTKDFSVDFIAHLGTAFSIDDIVIQEINIENTLIKIASLESLYRLKEKTYRAIDQEDLLFLRKIMREGQ